LFNIYDDSYVRCKHNNDQYFCKECQQEIERRKQQKNHEESVRKQRNKLKIAPWRKNED